MTTFDTLLERNQDFASHEFSKDVPLMPRAMIIGCVDHRVRVVTLTEEGKQVLAQAMPFWQPAQKQMLQQLGLEHVEALLAELSTAVESRH